MPLLTQKYDVFQIPVKQDHQLTNISIISFGGFSLMG